MTAQLLQSPDPLVLLSHLAADRINSNSRLVSITAERVREIACSGTDSGKAKDVGKISVAACFDFLRLSCSVLGIEAPAEGRWALSLGAVLHAVEVLVQCTLPALHGAMRSSRCSLAPVVSLWVTQCMWNVLDWAGIEIYVKHAATQGPAHVAVFCVHLLAGLEATLVERAAEHDDAPETLLAAKFSGSNVDQKKLLRDFSALLDTLLPQAKHLVLQQEEYEKMK